MTEAIARGLAAWTARHRLLHRRLTMRPRQDPDLYRGPAGCNRLEAPEPAR